MERRPICCSSMLYEPAMLRAIRNKAVLYVHGHSARGTNPSLVEMMHFGVPVLAFDCVFNRFTTAENALYFDDSHALCAAMDALTPEKSLEIGAYMAVWRASATLGTSWARNISG